MSVSGTASPARNRATGKADIQVIGAGFGRTGTTSLRAALDMLGVGPCLHGFDFMGHPKYIRAWLRAARDPANADWDELLRGQRSTQDFPPAAFWRELSDYYPEAKVLLSVREEDSWYDSMTRTVFQVGLAMPPGVRRRVTRFLSATSSWLPPYPAMYAEIVYEGVFGGRLDREGAIEVYRRHNADVVAGLPPERLLVWRTGDGWEPLCAFLGVPVPDEPFPRLNDRSSFRSLLRQWPGYAVGQVRAAVRRRSGALRGLAGRETGARPSPDVAAAPPGTEPGGAAAIGGEQAPSRVGKAG